MSDRTNSIAANETTGVSGAQVVPTPSSAAHLWPPPSRRGRRHHVYDLNANMTDMPIPGNETVKQTAVYDAWNRMVEMQDHTGAEIAIYRYNGLNQRVHKGRPDGSANDYYYNENRQVLEERKGGSTNPYAQYVWDARYIDAPVVRFHDSNTDGTLDDTLYYATDANMNVTALVSTAPTADVGVAIGSASVQWACPAGPPSPQGMAPVVGRTGLGMPPRP